MTHASLFSGIGGPEVAATMLGWENLFHCEINEFGRKVLNYWYPKSKSYEDITKTDFSEWRGKVDVLTGGFPCQPFSYAGKRRGADDDRYLWPFMFKAIDQIRPTWVVAENVAGITTMVEQGEVVEMGGQASLFEEVDGLHRYRLVETFTLQRICDDLEGLGYSVQPVLVPACAVGAPHRRDRVFIVGKRLATDTSEPRSESMRQEREDAIHRPEPTADTDGFRGDQVEKRNRLLFADGAKFVGIGGKWTPADTKEQSGKRMRPRQSEVGESAQVEPGGGSGEDGTAGGGRWDYSEEGLWLPSQSPIHRGNDGLPFDVDRLTLSFGKWRTESLKAYGNAIVPQVMYEIFRAIELTDMKQITTNRRVEAVTK